MGTTPKVSGQAALQAVVGDGVLALEPARQSGGCRLGTEVAPKNADELSGCLRVLAGEGEAVLIEGAGSRMNYGNPVQGASTLLSCRNLSGIVEFDSADGVIQARAGTPLQELAEAVSEEGWLLPLDPPDRGGSLGGVLATAISGPRERGLGSVRDAVLGLDTVLASGDPARCGARVVKNVTGYDMAKLYVGSLGTLGVIEKAWLRLKPVPLSCRSVELEIPWSEDPFGLALEAARRSSARGVALWAGDGSSAEGPEGSLRLLAEFAGEAPATGEDATWLARGRVASEVTGAGMDAVRDLQGRPLPGGLRARVHVLPTRLGSAWKGLEGPGVELLAYPEPAVLHARFDPAQEGSGEFAWLGEALERLDSLRQNWGAEVVIEELPEGAPGDLDVFRSAANLDLMRTLKDRFDPLGILNPGRFAGRI